MSDAVENAKALLDRLDAEDVELVAVPRSVLRQSYRALFGSLSYLTAIEKAEAIRQGAKEDNYSPLCNEVHDAVHVLARIKDKEAIPPDCLTPHVE